MTARFASIKMLSLALVAALGCAVPVAQAQAQASSYPNRQIHLVLPFAAGGPTDLLGRTIAKELGTVWNQAVVVDNRAGAGGTIGANYVAQSPPDGYTLLFATAGVVAVNPSLYAHLPYDTVRDLAPVTLVAKVDSVLVVPAAFPAKTFAEFVQMMKAKPGAYNYASSGTGSGAHLGMETLKTAAHIQINHIPYKGAEPGIMDLLADRDQAMLVGLPAVLPQIKSGQLRALAMGGLHRSPYLPNVPTFAESGLPGFEATTWFGILVPAATPPAIVAKLNAALVKIIHSTEMKQELASMAYEGTGSTPTEFKVYLAAEMNKWATVIKASGIKPE